MIDFAYYNGAFLPYSEMKIPLGDRSIFFGDGVYDVMIGEGRRVYQAARHLDRLFYSARHIGIEQLPDRGELCRIIARLTELAGSDGYLLYIQLSRLGSRRSHVYGSDIQTSLLATVREHSIPDQSIPIRLITRPDLRYKLCHLKTLNLLPAVLAANEAARLGADEAALVRDGLVTECSHSSIFIISRGVVRTHPLTNSILPGITRACLLQACSALGILTEERAFTVEELYEADEILVTSTTTLARRACSVDGRPCGMSDERTALRLTEWLKNHYIASIRQQQD